MSVVCQMMTVGAAALTGILPISTLAPESATSNLAFVSSGISRQASIGGKFCKKIGTVRDTAAGSFRCTAVGNRRVWRRYPSATTTTTTVVSTTSTLSPSASFDARGWESEILRITNVERQKAGLNPLAACTRLATSALAHTNRMLEGQFFLHDDPITGTKPVNRIQLTGYMDSTNNWGVGENIAMGYTSASAMMTAWMNSPGHRANILYPSFTHLGVGVNIGKWDAWYIPIYGERWATMGTQNFGFGGTC